MGYLRDLDILHQIVSRLKMLKEATESRSSLPSAQILTLGIVQPRVAEVGLSGLKTRETEERDTEPIWQHVGLFIFIVIDFSFFS